MQARKKWMLIFDHSFFYLLWILIFINLLFNFFIVEAERIGGFYLFCMLIFLVFFPLEVFYKFLFIYFSAFITPDVLIAG